MELLRAFRDHALGLLDWKPCDSRFVRYSGRCILPSSQPIPSATMAVV